MDLKDLKKSISEMSDEELLAHVMGTRAARRHVPTQKRAAAKKEAVQRKVKHKQTAATNELSALFASLSPEQQAALLKQLEGGNK